MTDHPDTIARQLADALTDLAAAERDRDRAVLAQRAAEARAEADNAALRAALEHTRDAWGIKGSGNPIERALAAEHPGAALLAELEAARAVVAVLEANRIHGRCPLCGALSEHTAGCAIGRYDEAVKAREK